MGNIENTAVNDLIARVSGGPRLTPSPQRIVTVPPLTSPRDGGSRPGPAKLRHPPAVTAAESPAAPAEPSRADPARGAAAGMPVAAAFEARAASLPVSYPVVSRALLAPDEPTPAPGAGEAQGWTPPDRLDPRDLYQLVHEAERERMVPTFRVRRRSEVRTAVAKLVLPTAILVSVGIVLGAYVGFGGSGPRGEITPAVAAPPAPAPSPPSVPAPAPAAASVPEPAPAAASVPEPAPAAASVPEPAPAAAPAPEATPASGAEGSADAPPAAPRSPALVDVRIDSTPSGATVMLVDRGRTQLIGDTPIETAVDPSRDYDLVFTYADRPPHIEHFDPRATRHVAAVLRGRDPAARPADATARRSEHTARESAGKPARPRTEPAAGEGILMISTKPPCEIVIDGKTTGLTTPQRSIALAAGSHRITLVNREKSIRKTVSVQIAANATEKLIEDLMSER